MSTDRPTTMRAMVLNGPGQPLSEQRREIPTPGAHQILIRLLACAVCRTDLHVQDNELPEIHYPVIPGHQAVGEVVATGPDATFANGARVGVAWLAGTCGRCEFCRSDRENLCESARFHGYHVDGGFAEFILADSRFCFPLDNTQAPSAQTPLLCGGLIGYRTLRLAGDAGSVGIYGFGSAAHMVTQVARHQQRRVFAFTSPGDDAAQSFAMQLGAEWAGGSDEEAPEPLDAALIFAPVGALVPKALRDLKKGGTVVCGGIHMSDIPSFPYADLWEERQIRSVANLTRTDGHEFLRLAGEIPVQARITTYPLAEANRALDDLRHGAVNGTAVLIMD